MKLTFLGTSHGVPAPDRNCTSTLLTVNGVNYLIDAGAPVVETLIQRGIALSSIRAIFTTHVHGDHTGGIIHFADIANWHYTDVNVDIYLTEEKAVQAFINVIECMEAEALDKERIRFRVMTPETVYEDENIRVTPLPTAHMAHVGHPSCGYLIEAEGKTVLFTGDLSPRLREGDFPARALEAPVDLLVSEFAHFAFDELEPYLARCQARRVFFTHVNRLEKFAQARAVDGKYGWPSHCPVDGEELIL